MAAMCGWLLKKSGGKISGRKRRGSLNELTVGEVARKW